MSRLAPTPAQAASIPKQSVPPPLVLASASPRRRDLLAQIGFAPAEVVPADIDETPLPNEPAGAYARRMASAKADVVAAARSEAVVLGADTVVACGRRLLPKAEDAATARRCLALLSGRRHRVVSAVTVIGTDGIARTRVVTTMVAFKRMSEGERDAYIGGGEWQGKAGGYAIQGSAARYIRAVNGSYSAVVGLPLHETYLLLTGTGLKPAAQT